MVQRIQLKYLNPQMQIGLVSWREVYLLKKQPEKLLVEVERGRLIYRARGSSKRISYIQVRKGLIKTDRFIEQDIPSWL